MMEKELNINCDQYLPGNIDSLIMKYMYPGNAISEDIAKARYEYIKKLDKKHNFKRYTDKLKKKYYKVLIHTNYTKMYVSTFRSFLRDPLIEDICEYINIKYLSDINRIQIKYGHDGIELYINLDRSVSIERR